MEESRCRVLRGGESFDGKQGLSYGEGVSAESCGARALCMHMLTMAPGARARVHLHERHETAILLLEGRVDFRHGERLQHLELCEPGDWIYIPAGVPHAPWNPSLEQTARAVLARTDPNEQESVVLRPDLDPLLDELIRASNAVADALDR